MAGKKDAAWWREYRRQKKAELSPHATPSATPDETPVVDTSDTSHPRRTENCRTCDLTYPAGTEHRCTDGWSDPPTVSRETPIEVVKLPPLVTREEVAAFKRAEYERVKPAFLAAPDDDCASCGHDRQTYHLNAGGVCWAPALHKRSRRCECPAFLDPSEPF